MPRVTVTADNDPVVLADAFIGLIDYSDAMDVQLRLRMADARAEYDRGYQAGDQAGYLRAVAEHKAVQRDLQRGWAELSELAKRRRLPARRPGDFPGRAS